MEAFKVVAQDDSRYVWVVHPAAAEPDGIGFSPVSFSTEEAAKADLNIYLNSVRDGNGRTIRTNAQIEALLSTAAEVYPDCRGVSLFIVKRQKNDTADCNWYVDANSADVAKCVSRMEGAIAALQKAYSIADRG